MSVNQTLTDLTVAQNFDQKWWKSEIRNIAIYNFSSHIEFVFILAAEITESFGLNSLGPL